MIKRVNWRWGNQGPGKLRMTKRVARVFGTDNRVIEFRAPPCRTLKDMTREEIWAPERQYGCRVTGLEARV